MVIMVTGLKAALNAFFFGAPQEEPRRLSHEDYAKRLVPVSIGIQELAIDAVNSQVRRCHIGNIRLKGNQSHGL